ncbi:MAG: patatin-like phospholipase family protein [Candidatus Neomarinimicrobiota bacterium]
MQRSSIGLALGGGGVRGAAHIGVLQVLHDHGIFINTIGGTSIGAIIGAMYAATQDPYWVEERFREFLDSDSYKQVGTSLLLKDRDPDSVIGQIAKFVQDRLVIAIALNRDSIIKRSRLEKAIKFLVPVKTFEELKIPLNIYATDLQNGERVCYKSGDLIDAVVQSSSIPGYVQPTESNGHLFADGAVSVPIPVLEMKLIADFVIAINISRGTLDPMKKNSIIDIITRCDLITNLHLTAMMVDNANFIFQPDVLGLHWSEFDKFDILLENGVKEAKQNISRLADRLKIQNSWKFKLKQKLLGLR